jgi:hypothetical protein
VIGLCTGLFSRTCCTRVGSRRECGVGPHGIVLEDLFSTEVH